MQICSLTQTHYHASIPSLTFLQAGCPSCHSTNSIKALTACTIQIFIVIVIVIVVILVWCRWVFSKTILTRSVVIAKRLVQQLNVSTQSFERQMLNFLLPRRKYDLLNFLFYNARLSFPFIMSSLLLLAKCKCMLRWSQIWAWPLIKQHHPSTLILRMHVCPQSHTALSKDTH